MSLLTPALAVLLAYLIGSLSFAVIVSRGMGLQDPRHYGSGNPGATNVLRSGNRAAAVLTLAFDALKGYVPVLLVRVFGPAWGLDDTAAAFVGLAAFVGHLWPLFFGFKGGKGVATALGVLLALDLRLGGLAVLTWIVVFAITRVSSLSALVAATLAPVYGYYLLGQGPETKLPVGILAALSLLVLARHHSNIRKLLSGEESAFKKR